MLCDVIRFRSKTDDNLFAFVPGNCCENVGCRFEGDRKRRDALFDLFAATLDRPVIRHSRGENRNRCLGELFYDRAMHFLGGAHINALNTRGSFQIHRAADQKYFGPALCGGFGDGVAHLAGRTVSDVANRIEVFASRTSGNQNGFALQVSL